MVYTLRDIQERVGGELSSGGDEPISGVNALETAEAGQLAFAETDAYVPKVQATQASGIIVSTAFPSVAQKHLLRVANPRLAFVKAMWMFQAVTKASVGIHSSAAVASSARIGEEVTIGECAVVREGARIGRGTVIESGVHVGRDVVIGEECCIGPNVVIMAGCRLGNRVIVHGGTVIGGDGFGYVWMDGRHLKIPQLGSVVIEDDVELGCNVCVDRAMFGATIIRRGTKVDNLVQIAHSDVIGEHVIMAGQVGLAGSVTVGNGVMFGGQSGVVDHITIGEGARIGAATPVTKDVPPGQTVWGFPARPVQDVKQQMASVAVLPKWLRRLQQLIGSVGKLEQRVSTLEEDRSRQSAAR